MRIKKLYDKVKQLEASSQKEKYALPSSCYFLSQDEVVCYPRKIGDGRHPYQHDGLTLWAHSSGNISIQESMFNVFLTSTEGREPYLAFFLGEKDGNTFFPVSITGVAKQPIERDISRFTVFAQDGAYYFAETKSSIAVLRTFVDTNKRIWFYLNVENKSEAEKEVYLSAYFNPHLRHSDSDGFEDKWYKKCEKTSYGYSFKTIECLNRDNRLIHYVALRSENNKNLSFTTSKTVFTGSTNGSLYSAESLFNGKFSEEKAFTEFTDIAVAGEINTVKLLPKQSYQVCYLLAVSDDFSLAERTINEIPSLLEAIESEALRATENRNSVKNFKLVADGLEARLSGKERVFNYFLSSVVRQTDFCARAKNYAGAYIGVRDIMQQIEAAVYWDAPLVRRRIVETLNYIGEDGRAPRQYSYQPSESVPPLMDLRAFIDQGLWVISTVYTYLAFTGDFSILNEVCGYYDFSGLSTLAIGVRVKFSNRKDTVLQHLFAIMDFLISNLDEETNCLHALYGDWNDALDGLGKTDKKGQDYGTGVSVMASLQLYKNLNEMMEITSCLGGYQKKIDNYLQIREKLAGGLLKHAITVSGTERKILHGWGDDKSWFVGSFCDSDGKSRDGLTSNAFWILSGLYKEYGDIIPDILKAYTRLDAKYGVKTFEPAFDFNDEKVGRIKVLPKGTAENGATYNHSTCFAVWSLFEINEGKLAWDLLYKLLPITHEFISTSPFIMPNSFIHNPEKGFDGESMGDWFTGAGCVLLKLLVNGAFGIKPTLSGVEISPVSYMPFDRFELTLQLYGKPFILKYEKQGLSGRRFILNGKEVVNEKIFIAKNELSNDKNIVTVID